MRGEEERCLIAKREVGRRGDGTDARKGGEAGAWGWRHPISQFPALPSRRRAAVLHHAWRRWWQAALGRGGFGWGRDQRPQRPRPCWACSTPGIRDSPSAPSSTPLGPGVWAWKEIRILLGEWMASRQPPQWTQSINVYDAPTVCRVQPRSPPAAGLRNCTICSVTPSS